MKNLIIFIFSLLPISAIAWECVDGYSSGDSIEKHIETASDIVFGRVVEGQYIDGDINFTLKPYEVIKGKKKKIYELSTSHYELFTGIGLGDNYIVFLYGKSRIDFCGRLIGVSQHLTSFEEIVTRPEAEEQKIVEYFLKSKSQVKN